MSRRFSSGSRFEALPIEGETDLPSEQVPGPSGLQTSMGTPTSGSGQGYVKPRSISCEPVSSEVPSDLEFAWGHYSRETNIFENLGLEDVFGKLEITQESQQQQDFPKCVEEDIPRLKDIGFNIEYPDGKIGAGLYGNVYLGYYGTDV